MQRMVALALVGSMFGFSTSAFAQAAPEKMPLGTQRPGFLHDAIGREAARAAQQATAAQAGAEVPHVSWRARHPVGFGALVGSALPLVGTGIGACVGHFASAKQKKYEPPVSMPPDIRAVKRIVALLGPGKQISIIKVNGEQSSGNIAGIAVDMFSIIPDGQTTSLPIAYADIRSLRGKPMSALAKTGVAACALVPAVAIGLFFAFPPN